MKKATVNEAIFEFIVNNTATDYESTVGIRTYEQILADEGLSPYQTRTIKKEFKPDRVRRRDYFFFEEE